MRTRTWLVAALLFGSGTCALVYQVGWLREFRLIFGSSTAASAAVLAIFIGGLGFGGLLLGPRADRHPRPLLYYARLESLVALSAAASPFLLGLVQRLYVASGGSLRLGAAAAAVGRLVLSAVVLAVPTVAMGGTLPAAARGAMRESDVRRQDVAALYALNTLGAVSGCVVATFWLLEQFGTRSTLWLAAAVNLLIAMLACQADRSFAAHTPQQTDGWSNRLREPLRRSAVALAEAERPALHPEGAIADAPVVSGLSRTEHPAPSAKHPAPVWFVLLAAGVVGFAFFLMELVWYRLLAPLLGGSVFTFGLVLAVALAGVGLGGLSYAVTAGDRPATLSGFGSCCLLEALAVAATYALGDRIAVLALALLPLDAASFTARVAGWAVVTAIVVLPPSIVAGYQFPLLIALFGRGREEVGRQIGLAYAANTTGAIVGSLAGGFGVLPWLSATGAWRMVALVLLLLGLTAVALSVLAAPAVRLKPDTTEAGVRSG